MTQELNLWLIGGGLALGVLFGLIVQRSRFCVLAAVSNWVLMRDLRQAHGYLAAVAVAIAGTALLEVTGIVPVAESMYRGGRIDWLGALGGGVVFGVGVVLAGGCAGRLLVRGAEGNTGALLALAAAALGAAATAYGALAPVRTAVATTTAVTLGSNDASVAALFGMPVWAVAAAVAVVGALAIGVGLRRSASGGMVFAGVAIGALIVAGWFVTGYLARDEFDVAAQRPVSLTFAGPLAQFMRYVASGEVTGNVFHLTLVAGALFGAFASAAWRGNFRWAMPAGAEMIRVTLGGGLMGIGAVCAGGCNIGQGLTGMSTLSISSLIAVGGMVLGMRLGLAWLMRAERDPATDHSPFRQAWRLVCARWTGARHGPAPHADVADCCR